MANRYYVGGNGGKIDLTSAWSATSGGVSGASVPTTADNVFIDSYTHNATLSYSSTPTIFCNNFTMSPNGLISFGAGPGSITINSRGNLILLGCDSTKSPIITTDQYSTQTLTTNTNWIYRLNVYDTLTLLDNVQCGSVFVSGIYGGIFDLNGYNVTCSSSVYLGGFYTTAGTVVTIYLRTGTISCTTFNISTGTITLVSGTATVILNNPVSNSLTLMPGGQLYNVLASKTTIFSGTGTGTYTINNLTLARGGTYQFVSGDTWVISNQIVQTGSGTTTINRASGSANFTWSSAVTLTVSNANVTNCTAAGTGNPFYASGVSTLTSTVNWLLGTPGALTGGWEFVETVKRKLPYNSPFQDLARVIPHRDAFRFPPVQLAPLYIAPMQPPRNDDVVPNLPTSPSVAVSAKPELPYSRFRPTFQALNLDVLTTLLLPGFAGFEASPASQYQVPGLRALNLDVLPALLQGFAGWEASAASPYRIPGLAALNLDVLPALLQGFTGWEASPASQYQVPGLRPLNLDVLPALLQGFTGWEASPTSPYRIPGLAALNLDVLPALLQGFTGWEASAASPYRIPGLAALNLDVLPSFLQGLAGFDASPASPYRIPRLAALNLDVLPALLQGFTGWEASPASQYQVPGLRALNLDVLPALLQGVAGFEASAASSYRIPRPRSLNQDVLARLIRRCPGFETSPATPYAIPRLRAQNFDVLPKTLRNKAWWETSPSVPYKTAPLRARQIEVYATIFETLAPWGFSPETPRPYQTPILKVGYDDLLPSPSYVSTIEVEPAFPPQYRIRPLQALNLDVLPDIQRQVIYPYSPDLPDVALRFLHPLWTPPDDYWQAIIVPPAPPVRLGVGGGEYVCETEEDINRRECLEKTIAAIDGELAEIERQARTQDHGNVILEPEVMPPDWQEGDDSGRWPYGRRTDDRDHRYDPRDPNTYGRGPTRHVHYNFASDMDFGVRRRIIGILDRAEHRGAQIFGSDAFVTQIEGKIHGNLIVPGTNAWVIQLGQEERLIVAKEALAEGFRLVSFDETSLSFIHRPTYPWKTLFLGATLGASLMGAGVGVGYLTWGKELKKLQEVALKQTQSKQLSKNPKTKRSRKK